MDCGNIRTSGKCKGNGWGLLPRPVLQTGNDGSRQEVEDAKVGRKELRVLREVVSIYFPSTPIPEIPSGLSQTWQRVKLLFN